MSVHIVTDSTCDLPDEIIEAYHITRLPLFINFIDKSYLDGVDISRQDFYGMLPAARKSPTTAAPGPEMFKRAYEQLAAMGATEILSIHISISLSSTVESARMAAQEVTSVPVTVLDSRQLSLGTGYQVMTAAKAAQEGHTVAEILEILEQQIPRTYVYAVLDTLEYLKRSGRMNGAVAKIGGLLQIKPILTMNDGHPKAEQARTREGGLQRIIRMVEALKPLERLDMVHTNVPEAAEALRKRLAHLLPTDWNPWSMNVTPVLGANIGPGVVGVALIKI
jgi:DegV family protein with EDD domain